MFANLAAGGFACAHNGNLTNTITLRKQLVQTGSIFHTTSDTEATASVARSEKEKILDKLMDAISNIEGAYSLIIMTNKKMIGIRDPFGIRPLVLGKKEGAYVLASETCALDMIGASYIRDVKNGEMVVITEAGLESIQVFSQYKERPCIFERIYFSRPDSIVDGQTVYTYRKNG